MRLFDQERDRPFVEEESCFVIHDFGTRGNLSDAHIANASRERGNERPSSGTVGEHETHGSRPPVP